jgi:YVTN family beta-propeller protein
MKRVSIFIISFFLHNAFAQDFKITKKIAVEGSEGWDYLSVNEPAQQLFISHGNTVNVVDLKTEKTIASIPNTNGVHGIAIANDLNKAFITDGKDNAVTVINLSTFEIIEKVQIEGLKPDAVLYDAFSGKVFVYNAKSNNAVVLDAKTNKMAAVIPLEGKPEFSVTNKKGLVYVNIENTNQIKVIDTKTLTVTKTWSIAPGEEPSGLAIDLADNLLFAVCSNKMLVVVNAATGKVIQTLPIGDGCDGVAFDPKKNLVFTANGDGTLTIIQKESKSKFKVVQTLQTQQGARTITLDKSTEILYTPTSEFGKRPEPTPENKSPRPAIRPNTFKVLVIGQM